MTPRELLVCAEAHREMMALETEQRQAQAYNNAVATVLCLSASLGKKDFPSFKEIFDAEDKSEMSDEQMYAQVRALNALFGGTDDTKAKEA